MKFKSFKPHPFLICGLLLVLCGFTFLEVKHKASAKITEGNTLDKIVLLSQDRCFVLLNKTKKLITSLYASEKEDGPVLLPSGRYSGVLPAEYIQVYHLSHSKQNEVVKLFDGDVDNSVVPDWKPLVKPSEIWVRIPEELKFNLENLEFYDGNGDIVTGAVRTYFIRRSAVADGSWKREQGPVFDGKDFRAWSTGKDPLLWSPEKTDARYKLPETMDVAYIVFKMDTHLPNEIRLMGNWLPYKKPALYKPEMAPLGNMLGMVILWPDVVDPRNVWAGVAEHKWEALKGYTAYRDYTDWKTFEGKEGEFTFEPSAWGGALRDTYYQRMHDAGKEVMVCPQNVPDWFLEANYPKELRGGSNVPKAWDADGEDPKSYAKIAQLYYRVTARYGRNKDIPQEFLTVREEPFYPNQPANKPKAGLGTVQYIQIDNEPDMHWAGRQAYQNGREYAAISSACYDGHKGALGPGHGVKTADPSMQVVVGGIVGGVGFMRGMIDWSKENRGYKLNDKGKKVVDLPFDIIDYHVYHNTANSTQDQQKSTTGICPEKSTATERAIAFLQLSHEECGGMPVQISETGYDIHPESTQRALTTPTRSILQTQADWGIRTALLYARLGIYRIYTYMATDVTDPTATKYTTSGEIDKVNGYKRRPAADFKAQLNKLMGNYSYKKTLSADPAVDVYALNKDEMYVLWIPDHVSRTGVYELNLGSSKAVIHSFVEGADEMKKEVVSTENGKLKITVTETPVFVSRQ
ncbi:hypothetical protein ACFS7Z_03215 [Pontibacter toksunensis]|uniref:Uncharacterized protein n=1 Tax=Pontibacter toksunensis TaxID=1332631 RepID=A0ABW6BSG3_9BACT